MDVYLNVVVIYSDMAEDHIRHIKTVIEILKTKKFYLSNYKLNFFVNLLKVLGQIIGLGSIAIDLNKVDKVSRWKIPSTKKVIVFLLVLLGLLPQTILV